MHRLLGDVYAPLYLRKLAEAMASRAPGARFTIKVARGRIVPCVMGDDGVIDIDEKRFERVLREAARTKSWARKAIADGVLR